MGKTQTVKVRLDVDTSRLVKVIEALRDGLLDISADIEALAESFGALMTSLAELEEAEGGGADTADRRRDAQAPEGRREDR